MEIFIFNFYFNFNAGTADGSINVYNVPAKGNSVKLQETLNTHTCSITDLHGQEGEDYMVSGDDLGNITLWKAGGAFKKVLEISGYG